MERRASRTSSKKSNKKGRDSKDGCRHCQSNQRLLIPKMLQLRWRRYSATCTTNPTNSLLSGRQPPTQISRTSMCTDVRSRESMFAGARSRENVLLIQRKFDNKVDFLLICVSRKCCFSMNISVIFFSL